VTVHYTLKPYRLTGEANVYSGQVKLAGLVGLDQLADRIAEQGSTVGRADVLAVLETAFEAAASLLQSGFRVQLGGLCDLYPVLKGRFEGADDSFDPQRHRLDLGATPGTRLRRRFRSETTLSRQAAVVPVPNLTGFTLTGSGTADSPKCDSVSDNGSHNYLTRSQEKGCLHPDNAIPCPQHESSSCPSRQVTAAASIPDADTPTLPAALAAADTMIALVQGVTTAVNEMTSDIAASMSRGRAAASEPHYNAAAPHAHPEPTPPASGPTPQNPSPNSYPSNFSHLSHLHPNPQASSPKSQDPAPTSLQTLHPDASAARTNANAYAAGVIGTICGYRLKFNPAAADEGIFFIPLSGAVIHAGSDNAALTLHPNLPGHSCDGPVTGCLHPLHQSGSASNAAPSPLAGEHRLASLGDIRVDPACVTRNLPKELVFLTPPLEPGSYRLEVRTRYRPTGQLRTGAASQVLVA